MFRFRFVLALMFASALLVTVFERRGAGQRQLARRQSPPSTTSYSRRTIAATEPKGRRSITSEIRRCANCDQYRPLTNSTGVCETCETAAGIAEGPRAAWKQFAEEIGGEYAFTEADRSRTTIITARWRDWIVTFEELWNKPSDVDDATLDTSVQVPFQAGDRLRFRAYQREGLLSAIVTAFLLGVVATAVVGSSLLGLTVVLMGTKVGIAWFLLWSVGPFLLTFVSALLYMTRPALEVGDSVFQRDVRVRGNEQRKIKAFFANSKIRQLFRDQSPGSWLQVNQPRRLLGLRFGRTELRFYSKSREIVDSGQLRSVYDLVGESLNQLVAIGSAIEEAPEIPSDS